MNDDFMTDSVVIAEKDVENSMGTVAGLLAVRLAVGALILFVGLALCMGPLF